MQYDIILILTTGGNTYGRNDSDDEAISSDKGRK